MADQGNKGTWKHCWERKGDPMQVPAPNGRMRYDQRYVCRTCGAEIVAGCSGKVRTSVWKKQGVELCHNQLVKGVHAL